VDNFYGAYSNWDGFGHDASDNDTNFFFFSSCFNQTRSIGRKANIIDLLYNLLEKDLDAIEHHLGVKGFW
jgi:hypothetical protein